jgi:hypothetical protein
VTAARIEAVRASGGEPFGDYQVPLAILALQQGLGRLIRHRRDRGRPRRARSPSADKGLRPPLPRIVAERAGRARAAASSASSQSCKITAVWYLFIRRIYGRPNHHAADVVRWSLSPRFSSAPSGIRAGSSAMIEGTVKDIKGEIVVGATVSFKSTDGMRSAQAKTNPQGPVPRKSALDPSRRIRNHRHLQGHGIDSVKMNLVPNMMSKADLTLADRKAIAASQNAASEKGKAEAAAKDKVAKLFGEGVTASNARQLRRSHCQVHRERSR